MDTLDSFNGLSDFDVFVSEGIGLGLLLDFFADLSMSSVLDCTSKSNWALRCDSLLFAKFLVGVVSLGCGEGVDFGEGCVNLSLVYLGVVSLKGTAEGVSLGEGCDSRLIATYLGALGVLCVGCGDGTGLGDGIGRFGFRGLSFLSVIAWNFLVLSSLLGNGFLGCGFRVPGSFSEI